MANVLEAIDLGRFFVGQAFCEDGGQARSYEHLGETKKATSTRGRTATKWRNLRANKTNGNSDYDNTKFETCSENINHTFVMLGQTLLESIN